MTNRFETATLDGGGGLAASRSVAAAVTALLKKLHANEYPCEHCFRRRALHVARTLSGTKVICESCAQDRRVDLSIIGQRDERRRQLARRRAR